MKQASEWYKIHAAQQAQHCQEKETASCTCHLLLAVKAARQQMDARRTAHILLLLGRRGRAAAAAAAAAATTTTADLTPQT